MDINDPKSIAFLFLQLLYASSNDGGRRYHRLLEIGWELDLTEKEIKGVVQLLFVHGLVELRSNPMGGITYGLYDPYAVLSEKGREHVKITATQP